MDGGRVHCGPVLKQEMYQMAKLTREGPLLFNVLPGETAAAIEPRIVNVQRLRYMVLGDDS